MVHPYAYGMECIERCLYMSNMDVRSYHMWSTASTTMTSWHHFDSTLTQICQNLSQLCRYNSVRVHLYDYRLHLNVLKHTLHMSNVDVGSSLHWFTAHDIRASFSIHFLCETMIVGSSPLESFNFASWWKAINGLVQRPKHSFQSAINSHSWQYHTKHVRLDFLQLWHIRFLHPASNVEFASAAAWKRYFISADAEDLRWWLSTLTPEDAILGKVGLHSVLHHISRCLVHAITIVKSCLQQMPTPHWTWLVHTSGCGGGVSPLHHVQCKNPSLKNFVGQFIPAALFHLWAVRLLYNLDCK